MERLERMTELWGSPNDSGGIFSRSPSHVNHGSKSQGTPIKKNSVKSSYLQASPQTPSYESDSFIPRHSSPSAAVDVLKAVHGSMTSAMANTSKYRAPFNRKAGASKIPVSQQTSATSFTHQEEQALVKSRLSQSPSTSCAQLQHGSPSTKFALWGSRSEEAERMRDMSPRHRSEEVLSSEEQELKVISILWRLHAA